MSSLQRSVRLPSSEALESELPPGRAAKRPPAWWKSLVEDKLALVAVIYLIVLVAAAVLAPVVAPFDPAAQSLLMRNQPPMSAPEDGGRVSHLLGTDFLGRDQLSRMLYGARVSLLVATFGVVISGVVGTTIGLISGYHRGLLDDVIMRIVDLQMSLPILLIALLVLYVLGSGLWNLVLVLAVTRWVIYARVARGVVLADREQVYIEAARSSGASTNRIIIRHLLPNLIPTLMVLATLEAASLMLAEATLSFLGLGLPLAEPSWGQMLAT
ncbi:MAG: ABC transporter permease, partial [Thermomicrobiales bacterium]